MFKQILRIAEAAKLRIKIAGHYKNNMKKWSPSLFGSLQDTKLCCAVYWCQCTAVGQLYQRTFGFGCVAISLIFWGLVASTILWATTSAISLDNMFNTDALTIDNPFTIDQYLFMTVFFGSLAPLCALASIVCGAVILCQIRQHIRRRDKLQVDLGDADDCCIPFWCGPCAMIQMLRHEFGCGIARVPKKRFVDLFPCCSVTSFQQTAISHKHS